MIGFYHRIARVWTRAFFTPESALNLACARVIFAAHAIWVLLSRDLPALSSLPRDFWGHVDQTQLWRYFIFPGHPEIEYALQALAIIALCGAVFGLAPRLACFVSALLLYHLAPLETFFWSANPYQRGFTVSVLALFTLSFSRCGDALRLGGSPASVPSAGYCWPLRLVQFQFATVYFFSGTAKLYLAGIEWIHPENLRNWFLVFAQQDQLQRSDRIFTTLGPWIAEYWLLCLAAAMFGVLANLLFITVPFSKYARRILVPDAVFFHIMVLLTLNIFWINTPQLLVFVNWQWLLRWLQEKFRALVGGLHVRAERRD